MNHKYSWIIERARSGEPVPIDTDRRDFSKIIDYLETVDGRGLAIQLDYSNGLIWVCLVN